MLNQVRFINFKALRDVTVQLGPLNVFVGPNGSGKTSILEGVHYLSQLATKSVQEVLAGWSDPGLLRRSGAEEPMRWWAKSNNYEFSYEFDSSPAGSRGEVQAQRLPTMKWSRYVPGLEHRDQFEDAFGGAMLLRPDANRIAAPSYSTGPIPQVQEDGSAVASALAILKLNHEERFTALVRELCGIVPSVRGIRFARAAIRRAETQVITVGEKPIPIELPREDWGDALTFDTASGDRIPARLMSEGTLLVMALLTAIEGLRHRAVLLLDDIDRALHPKAQAELVAAIRRLLEQKPHVQIIATSHSPYFIDCLKMEEVRLTVLSDAGDVVTARLEDHPEFDRWKDLMTPGEFWSSVGESWITSLPRGGAEQ